MVACLPQAPANISARGNQRLQNYIPDLSLPWLFCALLGLTVLKLHLSASPEKGWINLLTCLNWGVQTSQYLWKPQAILTWAIPEVRILQAGYNLLYQWKAATSMQVQSEGKKKKRHKCTWNSGMKEKSFSNYHSQSSYSFSSLAWEAYLESSCSGSSSQYRHAA